MSNQVDRRTFLEILAAMSAVPVSGCAAGGNGESDPITDQAVTNLGCGEKVVVLGAGLAGLTAAYNLANNGYDVTVLEGQNRVGGRVLTVRNGLKNNFHAEMGATRIFETHAYTLKYVNLFNLPLSTYDSGSRAFFMNNQRFAPPAAGQPWPLADMTAAERADPFSFFPPYLLSGFDKIGDIFDPGWPNNTPSALELDTVTFEQYMKNQGASQGWVDWLSAQEGNLNRFNAAAVFAVESVTGGNNLTSIQGGNDRLPLAFGAALGSRIKLNSKVVRLSQNSSGVTVNYLQGSQLREIRADHCVCTLPFSTLRNVNLSGANFAADKMTAIQNLKYMAAARCHFQTKTRFWQNDPLGPLGGLNLMATDTYAGRVWNTSSQQPDPTMGLIHAYMIDTNALDYANSGPNRIALLRQHFENDLLPGMAGQTVAAVEKIWQNDPWVGGGFGWTQPNEMATMHIARKRPEGRVHFAGEHTSVYIAWMNGAIESGERAAGEILDTAALKLAREVPESRPRPEGPVGSSFCQNSRKRPGSTNGQTGAG